MESELVWTNRDQWWDWPGQTRGLNLHRGRKAERAVIHPVRGFVKKPFVRNQGWHFSLRRFLLFRLSVVKRGAGTWLWAFPVAPGLGGAAECAVASDRTSRNSPDPTQGLSELTSCFPGAWVQSVASQPLLLALPPPSPVLVRFLYCVCGARNGSQGFPQVQQVFSHWVPSSASWSYFQERMSSSWWLELGGWWGWLCLNLKPKFFLIGPMGILVLPINVISPLPRADSLLQRVLYSDPPWPEPP